MKQSMLPASSPLPPLARSPFPQGGRLLVGCYSMIASESPLSVPLGHLSPKGETIFYMYALFVFVTSGGNGFFLGSCFAVAGVVALVGILGNKKHRSGCCGVFVCVVMLFV